ncbi:uncharacterized protein [Temnothorax longispinosus]|uniref:uncharacterized protein isoform X2 n=1 Tax=Temnothorax longispinosus TaxID=300112 RepID=UPI003A99B12B
MTNLGSNSNDGGKPRETVILVLKEERFEVEKQKLIDKSQYFDALLSMNYLEYGQTEHIINYDISPIVLKDFIDWIHHDKIIFTSATSYNIEEIRSLDRLLILLELSVLFATDKLIEDITDRLERHFMSPKYVIDIWLLAQELNINVLRDLSLAVCLDRFDELPLDSICELSKKHFIRLIGNINLRATESHLLDITREWMNHHHDFTVSLDIIENKKAKILQGVMSCENINDVVEKSHVTGRPLEGVQITARRYDLYLCGGEYGIGSKKFNKNVWRYSLISKKWILETVMPVERRHMITVFLKDKLYLVGGVGRLRQDRQTIDIYDIYTGVWTSSRAKITSFTGVPQHFIFNDKLIIQQNNTNMIYHMYFPDEDVCETLSAFISCTPNINANISESYGIRILRHTTADIPILTLKHMSCYIDVVDQDEMALKVVTETCNVEGCNNIINTFLKSYHERVEGRDIYKEENSDLYYLLHAKCAEWFLTPFFHFTHSFNYKDRPAILLCKGTDERDPLRKLHLHSIPIQEPRKFRSLLLTKKNLTKKLFNIHHPAYLHTTNLDHI